MSKDLKTKEGQKLFIDGYLDELLDGINESYGPILLKELQKRLEFTINEFNEEINEAFGTLKKRDKIRRETTNDNSLHVESDANIDSQAEWEKKLDEIEVKK